MCNKNAMSLPLATHENGFDLSSGGTRVNQTIRSLLPAICVFWLKIHWFKYSSILCVHSYKLRLSFCVVFCLVRAVRECDLGILLSKLFTSLFNRTYIFSCVVSIGIRYPIVIKVTAVLMSLQHCPVSFGFIWYILIPQIPPSKTLPIQLEDLYGTCFNPLNTMLNPICHLLALLEAHHILRVSRIRVKDTSHNVSYIPFSVCKFRTLWAR